MAWTDKEGRTWLHRRPNGWPPDNKAPDGGVSYGWRRVTNGRVQFAKQWWTAAELSSREGRFIRVETDCYYWTEASAYLGHEDACPETYRAHHNSFYENGILLSSLGDTVRAKA